MLPIRAPLYTASNIPHQELEHTPCYPSEHHCTQQATSHTKNWSTHLATHQSNTVHSKQHPTPRTGAHTLLPTRAPLYTASNIPHQELEHAPCYPSEQHCTQQATSHTKNWSTYLATHQSTTVHSKQHPTPRTGARTLLPLSS